MCVCVYVYVYACVCVCLSIVRANHSSTLYTCSLESGLRVRKDHVVGVDIDGIITACLPATSDEASELLESPLMRELSAGSFLVPGFCDLHNHAAQAQYTGTATDLPLLQWLEA